MTRIGRLSLTNVLVAINVVVFAWQVFTGGPEVDHGQLLGPLVVQNGQWWRIVAAAFLHGNVVHIALNMFALFQVGNLVESLFGKVRFVVLYALSIVGSGLAIIAFSYEQPTLGASGAIFGLFGALVAVGLRLGSRGRSLIGQVLPIVGINLVLTFSIPGISASGHVGGLVTGFLAGLALFMMPSRQREYAYAFVAPPPHDVPAAAEPEPVETIEHPPVAAAHDDGAPVLETRNPRE